jgi:hypothetical protein
VTDRQTDCWVGGYWKVGPIDDSLGKEVVTRLITNLTSNKEFYTDSNGGDFLKQVKIWCFCFLLMRSSAVEKIFTVQVLDCFGWPQLGNLMLPVVTPTIWAWGNFGVLGLIFLDWFAGVRSEDRLGLESQRAYCWQLLSSVHTPLSLHFKGLGFRILGVEGWGFRIGGHRKKTEHLLQLN